MAGDGAVAIAGGCTIAASVIAIGHIYMHLRNYTEPTYQRYIVRIIFMIHVYSMMSFLALVAPDKAIIFNSICGMYEAWVIYNFLSLCLAWVGGPGVVATSLQGRFLKPSWHLLTCCCEAIPLDGMFIRRCKQGVLQFVILKPLLVLAAFMLNWGNMYQDGSFSTSGGYLYITLMYTFSYTAALSSLVLFYVACKDLLRPFKPLSKFVIIKSVVFLTYWQGVLIAFLANGGIIKTAQDAADDENIVICFEMLLAALAHLHAFPYQNYAEANVGIQGGLWESILHALNFSDVVHDTLHQFAPTYHEYVLYSDGSQEAPQRYRVRTFVPTGQEMETLRKSKISFTTKLDESGSESGSPMGDPEKPNIDYLFTENPSTYEHHSAQPYDKSPLDARRGQGGIPSTKPPLPRKSMDNDFNPRASYTPEARRGGFLQSEAARNSIENFESTRKDVGRISQGQSNNQWTFANSNQACPNLQRHDSRRFSSGEEADELTKLTDRRASEHGALMDTIDIRGENDEYQEGFIQR